MSALTIAPIEWDSQVRPWHYQAAKERVSLAAGDQKAWYGVFDDGELVSVGFLWDQKGVARIGGLYTPGEHRGKGAGTLLAEFLMARAKDDLCSGIDLYSVNPPFWQAYGFQIVGRNGHGVARMFRAI